MDLPENTEVLDSFVRRIFAVQDITMGTPQSGYIRRYRGHLIGADSAAAYDALVDLLKPYSLTPLFRQENGEQVIMMVSSQPEPKPSRPGINLLMFILTIVSVLASGGLTSLEGALSSNPLVAAGQLIQAGWPFAVSLLAILAAHEFGHYFAGRAHGVHVTLPFFIPLPFTPLGTMGAFISMKEVPKNKRVLMDIGVAGPIAGYIVSIAVILIGLSLSRLDVIGWRPYLPLVIWNKSIPPAPSHYPDCIGQLGFCLVWLVALGRIGFSFRSHLCRTAGPDH